jgi:transaldolase
MDSIRIFYDGINIEKYGNNKHIQGFTTNCSIFGKSKCKTYKEFYEKNKDTIAGRCLSLQIWKDEPHEVIAQIQSIHEINSKIHVKVPIINTRGEYNEAPIKYAVMNNIPLNVTTIHTLEQIDKAKEFLQGSSAPEIISVFASPISDTLIIPDEYVRHAVENFKGKNNTEILWAGCRELYTIKRAAELGCHIITIPDAMMDRLHLLGKDLTELSIDRVRVFKNDAEKDEYSIM